MLKQTLRRHMPGSKLRHVALLAAAAISFYFARNRNFLLCLDTREETLDHAPLFHWVWRRAGAIIVVSCGTAYSMDALV
jgi:hypothetical protein